jgi:AGZA family xanthine/uracil permease-like MFS transporter
MSRAISEIAWDDPTEYAPAVVTMIAMPLTFSIATGIGFGFLCYAAGKLVTGQFDRLNSGVVAVALAFFLKFALVV